MIDSGGVALLQALLDGSLVLTATEKLLAERIRTLESEKAKLREVLTPFLAKNVDILRCENCGWPLADSQERGCVDGNCSQRPLPEWRYDYYEMNNRQRARRAYEETHDG